jgi:hypothetical protein
MAKPIPLRSWATPLTIGAFFLMAITGVLMFFEWNTGLTTVVHQWFSWGIITGPQLERPIEQALVEAPLSALASVTRTAPNALVHRLNARGIAATSQQSVRDLSTQSGESENRLLAIVFLPE